MLSVDRPTDHQIDGVDFTRALKGEAMDREPMFTLVPSHGATPHWLPPSISVHHGKWKLIRTFYHGKNQAHEYRLFNLETDIGEMQNLAATHPEIVDKLDLLITDYIRSTNVVVPRPNPKFDESVFNAQSIGVQPGGLKMPREFIRDQAPKKQLGGTTLIDSEKMLGWTIRGGSASIAQEALQIKAESKQALLINSAINVDGANALRIRIKTSKPITTTLQWRVAGQERFPDTGQKVSLDIKGGQWGRNER